MGILMSSHKNNFLLITFLVYLCTLNPPKIFQALQIHVGKSFWGLSQRFQGPYTAIAPIQPFTYGTSPYNAYPIKVSMPKCMDENIVVHGCLIQWMYICVGYDESINSVHGAPLQVRMPIVTTLSSPNTYMVMGVRDEWIVGRGGKTISDIHQVLSSFSAIYASLSSLFYIFPYHV